MYRSQGQEDMIPSSRLLPTYLEKQAQSLAIKHQREVGRYMTPTEVGEDLDMVKEVAVEEEAVVVVGAEAVEVDILVGNSTMEWTSLTLLGSSWMKNGLVSTTTLVMRYNRILSIRLVPFRTEKNNKRKAAAAELGNRFISDDDTVAIINRVMNA